MRCMRIAGSRRESLQQSMRKLDGESTSGLIASKKIFASDSTTSMLGCRDARHEIASLPTALSSRSSEQSRYLPIACDRPHGSNVRSLHSPIDSSHCSCMTLRDEEGFLDALMPDVEFLLVRRASASAIGSFSGRIHQWSNSSADEIVSVLIHRRFRFANRPAAAHAMSQARRPHRWVGKVGKRSAQGRPSRTAGCLLQGYMGTLEPSDSRPQALC